MTVGRLPRTDFAAMMELERREGDVFAAGSPEYPWGGVYGGQLVAQGLRAAAATVAPDFAPHVVHANYLRAADGSEPLLFAVERDRDGRSFAGRSVVARQAAGTVMTMTAGFHAGEEEWPAADRTRAAAPPPVPAPEELAPGGWSEMFDCRFVPDPGPARAVAWMRLNEAVADADPVLAACAVALLADDVPGDAALAVVFPDRSPAAGWQQAYDSLFSHSLDHNVWFHRPTGAAGWQLQDFRCRSFGDGRGMVVGEVFERSGAHIATVAQEVLVRRRRD